MSAIVSLPKGYQYAGASIVSTFWLTVWQAIRVNKARRKAGIPYPQLYADKAEAAASKDAFWFNCVQRAHQNTLETLTQVITATAITATQWPCFAAGACGAWVIARVLYTLGYSTGDPAKRNKYGAGPLGTLATLSLVTGATAAVAKNILDL